MRKQHLIRKIKSAEDLQIVEEDGAFVVTAFGKALHESDSRLGAEKYIELFVLPVIAGRKEKA